MRQFLVEQFGLAGCSRPGRFERAEAPTSYTINFACSAGGCSVRDEGEPIKGVQRFNRALTCEGLGRSRKCPRQWMCSGRSGAVGHSSINAPHSGTLKSLKIPGSSEIADVAGSRTGGIKRALVRRGTNPHNPRPCPHPRRYASVRPTRERLSSAARLPALSIDRKSASPPS